MGLRCKLGVGGHQFNLALVLAANIGFNFSMLKIFMSAFFCYLVIYSSACFAFSDKAMYLGAGFFSESILGKQTTSVTGASTTSGTATYPLFFKYDMQVGSAGYFVAPTVYYTVFSRSDPANSAKVTIWHLLLPYGGNFYGNWDWSAGLGILNRTIQGAGGIVQLNNGTGTSSFALPGGTVSSRVFTVNAGASYYFNASRFALDLVAEGAASSKRTFDFMLSYSYAFRGGLF